MDVNGRWRWLHTQWSTSPESRSRVLAHTPTDTDADDVSIWLSLCYCCWWCCLDGCCYRIQGRWGTQCVSSCKGMSESEGMWRVVGHGSRNDHGKLAILAWVQTRKNGMACQFVSSNAWSTSSKKSLPPLLFFLHASCGKKKEKQAAIGRNLAHHHWTSSARHMQKGQVFGTENDSGWTNMQFFWEQGGMACFLNFFLRRYETNAMATMHQVLLK